MTHFVPRSPNNLLAGDLYLFLSDRKRNEFFTIKSFAMKKRLLIGFFSLFLAVSCFAFRMPCTNVSHIDLITCPVPGFTNSVVTVYGETYYDQTVNAFKARVRSYGYCPGWEVRDENSIVRSESYSNSCQVYSRYHYSYRYELSLGQYSFSLAYNYGHLETDGYAFTSSCC